MKPPPPSDNRPPPVPSGPLHQIGVEEIFNTSGAENFLEEKFHSEVLQKICKDGCEVLGAERSLIVQLRKDHSIPREILCTHQIPLDFLDELRASTKKSILEEAFQENCVKVFSNIDRESHVFDPESVRRMGVCAIPLFVEETTSCALVLYHMTPKEYTDQDRKLAGSFGSLASTTIKNAQLTLKNRVRATQLEIVDQVAKEITSSLEPEDLFRNIARQIQRVAPYVRCLIASLDPAHKSFHIWHRESTIQDEPTRLRNDSEFFDWILERVYEPGRPMNLTNLHEANLPWFASRMSSGVQSYLFVPVLLEGKSIAHISLSSRQIGAFSQDQVDTLNLIASHLGLAIRNATLYRTIQERAARMGISGQIAKAVGSTLEPEELFQTIANEIRKVTPFDRCVIGNVEQGKCQVWWTISDIKMESLSSKFSTRISSWHREVYEKNKTISVPDILEDPSEEAKFLASNKIRSLMIIPISQEGRCVAHLTLNSLQPRAYTSQQERFLESISDYLGPAIRNMSLYKASEERAARLAVLNELNQKITQNLDLNEVLESITDAALKLLHGDHAHIRLFDSSTGDWVIRSVSGSIPKSDVLKTLSPKRAANLALKEDGSIEPMIFPDVQELRNWRRYEWACKFGIHSLIIHPLRVGANVIGAIACFSRERDYYRQEHLSLVSALASQASIAIQNAQLFQESEQKGRRLTTLIGAANKLAQELDLSMVLDSIVRAAGALFEGEAGLRLVEGNDLVRVATTPRGKEVMVFERIPIGWDIQWGGGQRRRPAHVFRHESG